jgi:hypothetical protein
MSDRLGDEPMSEHDDIFAHVAARCDRLDVLLRQIVDRLDRRLPDVPLHQRGFGVMDEPPP